MTDEELRRWAVEQAVKSGAHAVNVTEVAQQFYDWACLASEPDDGDHLEVMLHPTESFGDAYDRELERISEPEAA